MLFIKRQTWTFTLAAISAAFVINGCSPAQNSETPLSEPPQTEASGQEAGQEESISQEAQRETTQSNNSPDANDQSTVQRVEANDPSESSSAQPSSKAPIQTQFGPDQSEVDLMSAEVTGDILTVTLRYRPSADDNGLNYASIGDVKYIDDTTSQQYGVVKDQAGEWLASPKASNPDKILVNMGDSATIVWFKFPAPPTETESISITVPAVSPFDGVTVARRA